MKINGVFVSIASALFLGKGAGSSINNFLPVSPASPPIPTTYFPTPPHFCTRGV